MNTRSNSLYTESGVGPAARNSESQAAARDWAEFTRMNREAHDERKKREDSIHRRLQANGFEMVGDKKIQVKAGMKFMFPFDVSVKKPIGPIKKELHAGSSGPFYARANRIKTVTEKDLDKYNFEYVVGHTYVWFKK